MLLPAKAAIAASWAVWTGLACVGVAECWAMDCETRLAAGALAAGFVAVITGVHLIGYPSWVGRAHPLMDDIVPLWQIAYHGIILSNPFYSTIDYPFQRGKTPPKGNTPYYSLDNAATRRLKLVEFGGRPTFYFINYKDLKPIKAAYDEYQPLKYLQYEFMESHAEIAPNVFVTRYSDGSEIAVNYSDKEFVYKGRSVKPMAYELYRPAL